MLCCPEPEGTQRMREAPYFGKNPLGLGFFLTTDRASASLLSNKKLNQQKIQLINKYSLEGPIVHQIQPIELCELQ